MKPSIILIELKDDVIICELANDYIDIDRASFENWADDNDKREYCLDSYDPSEYDGHKQDSGKMDWDEYYASAYITNDLAEFYTVRDEKGAIRDLPDLGKSFKKLMAQIKLEKSA